MELSGGDTKVIGVVLVFQNNESAGAVSEVLQGVPSRRFSVRVVAPEEAVSAVSTDDAVDVVVVDVSPPVERGLNVVSSLKSANPGLPVVTWSDAGEDDLDDETLRRGAQEHMIGADISSESLVRGLLRAIQRSRLEGASADAPSSLSSVQMAAVGLLDRLSMGIIMADRDGRVRLVNRVARRLIEEKDGLNIDRAGIIRANTADQTHALHDLIRMCAGENAPELERNMDADGNLGISLNRPSGKPPFSLLAAPVGAQRPGAVLFVTDPDQPLAIAPETLVSLYGLTLAESRLVLGLVAGKQIENMSEELGTSIHTLRTQLKSIFRKTGAKRQTEVVKLILTGPAAIQGSYAPSPSKTGP